VLRLSRAYNLDATCAEAIAQVAHYAWARGQRLVLAGVKPEMYETLEHAGLVREMGPDPIFRHEPLLLAAMLKGPGPCPHAVVAGVQHRGVRRGDGRGSQ
jgi:anti-anti-sigma regulatory factor